MLAEYLIKNKELGDLFILSRYFYRIGEEIINDAQYDLIEKSFRNNPNKYEEFKEYLSRTYDDDPIPYDLLKKYDIKPAILVDFDEKYELAKYLDEEKSMSIEPYTSYSGCYWFFQQRRALQQDIMTSVKIDGVNNKELYVDNIFTLDLSRGRDGEGFDYTEGARLVVAPIIKSGQKHMKVFSEAYVEKDYLEVLRSKYPEVKFKTPKSAALSLLRVVREPEDYKHLKIKTFMAEGLANTLDEMFVKLEENDVDVVPHKLIKWEDIPENFDDFCVWLKKDVFDYFAPTKESIPSDGIVVEVNDLNFSGEINGQYSTRQIALKFEQWAFVKYKGIIKNIVFEQKRVLMSVRIEIEPLDVDDGATIQYINSYNPRIVIDNNLRVGEEVSFERDSGAISKLIREK